MRKIQKFQMMLWICLIIFYLTGCGSTEDNKDNEQNGVNNTGEVGETADTGKEEEDETTSNGLGTGIISGEATITEQVLLNQDDIKITAKSLDNKGFLGPELKVMIENSGKTNLTVQVRAVSVNGLMVEPSFSSDVAAGMKANDTITFLSTDMELNKIEVISEIELMLYIFNTDTWDTILESEVIVIETGAKDSHVQEYDSQGNVVYEGEGFKIIEKGIDTSDSIFGPKILFYIENNTDRSITVQTRDVSINGFMVEPAFSKDITPGKKAYDSLIFLDLEDNDIENITEVELKFDIFDQKSWETIVETGVIQLKYDEAL